MIKKIKDFLLTNTSDKQTVIKNTFWLIGSELVVRGLRFFLILYIARILGAEGWGLFSYAISLLGTALVFSDVGVSFLLLKEYAANKKQLLKTILTVKAGLLILSTIIAVIVGFFFASLPIATLVIPVSLTLIFDSARDFLGTLLRSKEKMEIEALVKTVTNIALVLLSLVLVYTYKTPAALALGYASGSFLGFILAVIFTSPLLREIKNDIVKEENSALFIRQVLSVVGPITISSLATTLMLNIDTIMLGIWWASTDIGFYASALRIFQTIMAVPGLFVIAILPKLSLYFIDNTEQFKKMISKSIITLFALSIPIAAGGFILAKPLMTLLFGQEYIQSGYAFAPLILGVLFAFPTNLLNSIAFIINKQKNVAINTCICLALSVGLNIYLIPTYGIVGAAIGTTLTQLTLFIANILLLRKNIKIEKKDIIIIFFAAILMSLFLLKISWGNVLFSIVIGMLIYISVLAISNKNLFKL